ncbi:SIS domain-containing protein [Alcanivorax sp. JB21]|uniref:D-sedoheptulose-7-phosphate isomerase n=1 Tax=Alcanivorax limicola TaxID=2874102 RepID=UPI001CBD9697|nr:SIS domain-containing protein [Alcanivorax limicola]MBZ2190297.1 SIS domain-containing protein [Alcanivorax limicola]
MSQDAKSSLRSFQAALERHSAVFFRMLDYQPQAEKLLMLTRNSLARGGKVLWLGNGGSAADCQHLAAEFMVRYRRERGPLSSIALTTDTSILTAHPNDYEFETVFERQVRGLARPGDLVIGLTTSGQSENVNRALTAANELGAISVALTGCDGGQVKDIATLAIIIDCEETARIQEAHMFIGHWLCEALDALETEAGDA